MAQNPKAGHTAAGTTGAQDGLRDGDHILSPSLTNIYEGLHGNGILLASDTAYGDGNRNDPNALPGAISTGADDSKIIVKAYSAILDGVLYAEADANVDLISTSPHKLDGSGTTALTNGKECIFVILATSKGVRWIQTTPITTAAGAYPSIGGSIADAYLKMDNGGLPDNKQAIVLGTIRASHSGGSVDGDLAIQAQSEINDKRVFIRPSPFYLSPVTSGVVGSTDHLNTHTALEQAHGIGQHGDFGNNGVLWLSYNQDENLPNLYFSAKDGSNRHTHLLGPNRILSLTAGRNFEFDDAQVFAFTGGSAKSLTPTGTFPPGHTVIVSNAGAGLVTFDPSGLNIGLANTEAVMFVYNGSAWVKVIHSSTVTHLASGATGLVQLSDGAGSHTSDAKLFWTSASSTLTVNGKLTVTGLIDPTGLELTPVASNPGGTTANTLWLDSGASNALKHGANTLLNSASSATALQVSATDKILGRDSSGAGAVEEIAPADVVTMLGIEPNADVTDATNVRAAIEGMTINAPATSIDAANDKILLIDNSASAGAILTEDTIANVITASGISGTVTSVTAGAGLTQSGTASVNPTIDVVGGDGITANANEVEATVDGSTIELSATDGSGALRVKDSGITLAKLANMATDSFMGRTTASAGAVEILSKTDALTILNVSDGANAGITALTGNVTASGTGSVAATIADEAVTYAKMQHVSATSRVLGRVSSGAGDVEELTGANLLSISGAVNAAGAIAALEAEATVDLTGTLRFRSEMEVIATDPAPTVAESGKIFVMTNPGAIAFTLPSTSLTIGTQYVIVNTAGADTNITPPGSDTINGANAVKNNTTQWAATTVVCYEVGSPNKWAAFGGI